MSGVYRLARSVKEYEELQEQLRSGQLLEDVEIVLALEHHLDQDKYWTTREDEKLWIAEMEPRHARNAYAYLHRKAQQVWWRYQWFQHLTLGNLAYPNGELAQDAYEAELDWEFNHPHEWLDSRRQVQALKARGEQEE